MIDQLIKEIDDALEHGLYIVALNSALTLPDICGKVAYPKLAGKRARYIRWFEEHVGKYERSPRFKDDEKMPYMSGEIVYALRCALTHEGNPSIRLSDHNLTSFKLLRTPDYTWGGSSGYCDSNGERTIEIAIWNLCFKLCCNAKRYYEENKDKFHFNYRIEDVKWLKKMPWIK
ncbi:MAG: hypothetical protein K6B51_04375 [Bacilli bacterium]|nr:hypothetical protein [Bacilli bacterium]